jgi:hypothetical protein
MVAVLPPSTAKPVQSTATSTERQDVLMIAGIKDKVGALSFIAKLKKPKDSGNKQVNLLDYKGQQIVETIERNRPTSVTYSTLIANHVLVSPEKRMLELAIDTAQGEPSFASKAGVNNILTRDIEMQNPLVQIYLPDLGGLVKRGLSAGSQSIPISPDTFKNLEQIQSVAAGLGVDDAGVRMKAVVKTNLQLPQAQSEETSGKVVALFPEDTIALINGRGLSRNWATIVQQSQTDTSLKQGLDVIRQGLRSNFSLDLDQDVFGWMDGEYGFAAIPVNQGMLANAGVGGAFVFDTSNRKAAETTFAKLDASAQTKFISVVPRSVGGRNFMEWKSFLGTLLIHGWLDQDTVFVALGEPIVEAIANPQGTRLNASNTFKAATASLPQPNSGYFYVDVERGLRLLERSPQSSQAIPSDTKAILESIRGIGSTMTNPDKSTSLAEILIALKPKTAK